MRNIAKILFVLAFIAFAMPTFAQLTKEQIKERKELSKMTKKEVESKASKDARKEAKKFLKEGWVITPGTLPIEKQLDKSWNMQYEIDENLNPKYIIGEAMSIGEVYDAAKFQAIELAKQRIAGLIKTEVTAVVKATEGNDQLSHEEAASVEEALSASEHLIMQSIGRVLPVVEMYREKTNKNKEVYVRLAYNYDMAMQDAKKVLRDELKKKSEELAKKVDCINWGVCKID